MERRLPVHPTSGHPCICDWSENPILGWVLRVTSEECPFHYWEPALTVTRYQVLISDVNP